MSAAPLPILYVEDEENDVYLVQFAFKSITDRIRLQVVRDGEEAEAYLEGTGAFADRSTYPMPVLVLMDLKLPKKMGLDVIAWMRSKAGLRELPVFVLSSSQESRDVERARALGVTGYLVKPGDLTGLIRTLRTVFDFAVERSPG